MRRAWLVILALLTLSGAAIAQTRQTLETYNNNNITANGQGLITGPIINSMNGQIINGAAFQNDVNHFTQPNTHSGPETFNGNVGFNGAVTFNGSAAFSTFGGALFAATAYGNCVWDGSPTHDVGSCIIAALNAAKANKGGRVLLPGGGPFYSAEQIQNTTNGVSIAGLGRGVPRDTNLSSTYQAVTIVKYNGPALMGTQPFLYIGPAQGATSWKVYGTDLLDVVFDAGNLTNVAVEINNVVDSKFRFGCSEPSASGYAGAWVTSQAGVDSEGTTRNHFDIACRAIGPSSNSIATPILIDGQGQFAVVSTTLAAAITSTSQTTIQVASDTGFPGSSNVNANFLLLIDNEYMQITGGWGTTTWTVTRGVNGSIAATHSNGATAAWNTNVNVSYNDFDNLEAYYSGANDGVVFGFSDTNPTGTIFTYRYNSLTAGNPVIFANQLYTSPNGVAVHDHNDNTHVIANMGTAAQWQGYTSGSSWQIVQENGTAGLNAVTATVNGAVSTPGINIAFNSVTGIAIGESINCGGASSGLYPNTLVRGVNSGANTINIPPPGVVSSGNITQIPDGQTCTFGYALSNSAVPGVYNLSWNGSSYDLTAPAGGTSQTNVSPSGGLLSFADIFIPWSSGTPATGDNWNIVVGIPATRGMVDSIDKDNAISDPYPEPGSSMCFKSTSQPTYVCGSPTGQVIGLNFNFGGINSGIPSPSFATGIGSIVVSGTGGNSASNTSSSIFGGFTNFAGGFNSWNGGGNNNTTTGPISAITGGQFATDRGRTASTAFASNRFATQGDAQRGEFMLMGSVVSGNMRLTSDKAAAGAAAPNANCINIPQSSSFAIPELTLSAINHTNPTQRWVAKWNLHRLTRDATNGTLFDGASSTVAPDASAGDGPIALGTPPVGIAATLAADATNNCASLIFTHPTSGTDQWNIVAYGRTVEVQ